MAVLLKLAATIVSAVVALPVVALATAIPASAAPVASSSRSTVGIVFPLSVPSSPTGFVEASALEFYTSPTGLLTQQLAEVSGTDIAVGIDPMLIASIRLLGSDAPPSAVEWLADLEALPNETFALAYADSDITLGLQGGSETVLAPLTFDFAIDPERFGPPAVASSSPDPVAPTDPVEPVIPPLPTSASLLDWQYTHTNVAWLQPNTLGKGDITAIAESGFETTILNSANVTRKDSTTPVVATSKQTLVVTDDELSALFNETIATESLDSYNAGVARLSSAVRKRGSVVLAVDRNSLGAESRLRETAEGLDRLSRADTAPLSDILAMDASSGGAAYTPHTRQQVRSTTAALAAERADAAFSSVAENPALITGERRVRLLAALAPQWSRNAGGFGNAMAEFIDDSRELRDSVAIAHGSDLLFGDRGFIPINVSNSLDQPVTVIVSIKPLSPVLDVENENFELEVQRDSQKRAQIPANALSNGSVSLAVSIRSTSDVPIGTTSIVRANVQAGWETPLTIGLGVGVVVIFVLGLIRSIRKRRKLLAEMAAEAEVEVEDDAEADADGQSHDADARPARAPSGGSASG